VAINISFAFSHKGRTLPNPFLDKINPDVVVPDRQSDLEDQIERGGPENKTEDRSGDHGPGRELLHHGICGNKRLNFGGGRSSHVGRHYYDMSAQLNPGILLGGDRASVPKIFRSTV